MSPIVTVEIPPWPAIACPICGDIGVNLDGELVLCERPECAAGASVRAMVPAQKAEALRRLRNLHAHVVDCEYCQRAGGRGRVRGQCVTGAELRGRWIAWLIPMPDVPGVRNLTDDEKAALRPLLAEMTEHVAECDACGLSENPPEGLCAVGREFWRRWCAFMDQTS